MSDDRFHDPKVPKYLIDHGLVLERKRHAMMAAERAKHGDPEQARQAAEAVADAFMEQTYTVRLRALQRELAARGMTEADLEADAALHQEIFAIAIREAEAV